MQQQLAQHWLPLLSPQGEALAEELVATGSFSFVETPQNSGFKGAYCFDWRGPNTPRARAWMRHRAVTDPRFDASSAHSGLCPVDLGYTYSRACC